MQIMKNILICPKCKCDLIEYDKCYKCPNNHNYDKSKRGYVNLLLANQMNACSPGDNKVMMNSRKEFLNCGYYEQLKNKILDYLEDNDNITIVDLGCGEGYYSYELSFTNTVYGLDISKDMINEASKKMNNKDNSNLHYVIASINNLPFVNSSVDVILNIFVPINLEEVKRVIKKNGKIIKVIPGEYHLYELKEILYDDVYLNTVNEFNDEDIKLINSYNLKYKININNHDLMNILIMTPYYYKTKKQDKEKLKCVDNLDVTFDFIIQEYECLKKR